MQALQTQSNVEAGKVLANRLLLSLSACTREQVLKHATWLDLPLRYPLVPAGHLPRYVYFLNKGLASHVVQFSSGSCVEVGMEGNEGCLDSLSLIGPRRTIPTCFMQIPGDGYRLDFEHAQALFRSSEEFRSRLLEFTQHHSFTIMQHSACNRLHLLEQRLARWLLMVKDRVGGPRLNLTQEFLGLMLGTQRTSVVVAVNDFQKRGLTRNGRGWIEIIDEANLLKTACECYQEGRRSLQDLYRA